VCMRVFKPVPLFSTLGFAPRGESSGRGRARTRPRLNWFLFWPWEHGVPTGEARFTLIQ